MNNLNVNVRGAIVDCAFAVTLFVVHGPFDIYI